MSPQADYVVANGTGAAVRSDINGQLAAIVSNNSGATAPSTTYAYQWWADTTTGLLKLRNAANNGWITLFQLDGEWSTLAVENGSAAAPSIYFKDSGTDTGVYSPGTDQVAISTGGTVRLSLSTTAVSSALAIDHPLGAVGTPSITFTGDLNTGIYSPAADTLAFVEGGVEAMRIDSSGRVGIGTTTPSTALHVVGGGYFTSNTFLIQEGGIFFNGVNAFNTGIYSRTNDLVMNAGSSERVRIDSSGRLLVGTSSAQGNSTVTIEQTGANSAPLALRYTNTNDNQIGIDFYRSRSSSAKVENTDPIMRLDAYGYDGSAYRKGASIEAIVDAATSAGDMPCRLVFSTTADGASSPTERMRIANNGVWSGFSDVVFNFRSAQAASASNAGIDLVHSATNIINGTLSFRVWTNGNVVNTNSSYGAISDIKLKENIVDANSQWSDIKALRIRNYNFKPETGHEIHKQLGLIAQEVELVSPGLVSASPDRDEDGNETGEVTKSVAYSVLYMKAVKALQEAMERIEQLEASNAAMEARLAALESA